MKNRVKRLREKNGWTQQTLATELKTKIENIDKIESGKYSLSDRVLVKLSIIFQVSIDYLLYQNIRINKESAEPIIYLEFKKLWDDFTKEEKEVVSDYMSLSRSSKDEIINFIEYKSLLLKNDE